MELIRKEQVEELKEIAYKELDNNEIIIKNLFQQFANTPIKLFVNQNENFKNNECVTWSSKFDGTISFLNEDITFRYKSTGLEVRYYSGVVDKSNYEKELTKISFLNNIYQNIELIEDTLKSISLENTKKYEDLKRDYDLQERRIAAKKEQEEKEELEKSLVLGTIYVEEGSYGRKTYYRLDKLTPKCAFVSILIKNSYNNCIFIYDTKRFERTPVINYIYRKTWKEVSENEI